MQTTAERDRKPAARVGHAYTEMKVCTVVHCWPVRQQICAQTFEARDVLRYS